MRVRPVLVLALRRKGKEPPMSIKKGSDQHDLNESPSARSAITFTDDELTVMAWEMCVPLESLGFNKKPDGSPDLSGPMRLGLEQAKGLLKRALTKAPSARSSTRDSVIEECAKVCDEAHSAYEQESQQLSSRDFSKTAHEVYNEGRGARECAERIRRLKGTPALPPTIERITEVVGADGKGVAAPCAIDGCALMTGQAKHIRDIPSTQRLRGDRGPWHIRKVGDMKLEVYSGDFVHDVVLTISGDFKSEDQLIEYAADIARVLEERSAIEEPRK